MSEQGEPPSTRPGGGWSDRPDGGRPRFTTRWDRGVIRPDLGAPLTPVLVPALFLGISGFCVLAGLVGIVLAFLGAIWLGVLALVVLPAVVLGLIMLARVAAEMCLAVLQMTEDVSGLAERFPALERTIFDLADVVPRFGFLKLLSGGRER